MQTRDSQDVKFVCSRLARDYLRLWLENAQSMLMHAYINACIDVAIYVARSSWLPADNDQMPLAIVM